jgi:hypothetical protein
MLFTHNFLLQKIASITYFLENKSLYIQHHLSFAFVCFEKNERINGLRHQICMLQMFAINYNPLTKKCHSIVLQLYITTNGINN